MSASLDYEEAVVCFQDRTLSGPAGTRRIVDRSRQIPDSQFVCKLYQPATIVEAYRKFT